MSVKFIYSEKANERKGKLTNYEKENIPIGKYFYVQIGKKRKIFPIWACELRNDKRRRQEQEDKHNCTRPRERPRSHQNDDFAKKL